VFGPGDEAEWTSEQADDFVRRQRENPYNPYIMYWFGEPVDTVMGEGLARPRGRYVTRGAHCCVELPGPRFINMPRVWMRPLKNG
jgi:hypothetical protein